MDKYRIKVIQHLLRNNEIAQSGDIVEASKLINLQDSIDGGFVELVKEEFEELEAAKNLEVTETEELEELEDVEELEELEDVEEEVKSELKKSKNKSKKKK